MSPARRMLLLLLLALVPLCSADFNCSGTGAPWTADERKDILEVHNEFRKKIREGNYVAGREKGHSIRVLPAEAGTYPDMAYNCTIEKSAQNWAKKCPEGHSEKAEDRNGYGENLMWKWGDAKLATGGKGISAAKGWTSEVDTHGWPCNKYVVGVSQEIGHATQMAWAKSTQIGCGVRRCPSSRKPSSPFMVVVVCHYSEHGNVIGGNIYEAKGGVEPRCPSAASRLSLLCPLLLLLSWLG